MNGNNSMQSSRTLESQHAGITALAPGDALNAVRMLAKLELDGNQKNLSQVSNDGSLHTVQRC